MTEWNFEPPPGIHEREAGLPALLRKIRYDLTAAQSKLTEAIRQVGELDLDDNPDHASFINGPVLADHCPECGCGANLHTTDCPLDESRSSASDSVKTRASDGDEEPDLG